MATPDQIVAAEQFRHLNGKKQRLQDEFALIANAVVVPRRQEIVDMIQAINAQLVIIAPRLPPPPAPAPPPE